jgi:phosphoglycolate phosphatase-like HAD superfamily hydrolase
MKKEKLIVLDCDGVLLNYNQTFGKIYEQYFNEPLTVTNSNAYHAENYYGKKIPDNKRKSFFEFFDKHGWANMEPLPKSVEATHLLKEAGYKILVVTSIPKNSQDIRHNNLINAGFAVDATIAVGHKLSKQNPKKMYLDVLNPEYFIDDLIDNFHQVEHDVNLVLIDSNAPDSPNFKFEHPILLHSTHPSLWDFVHTHIKK